MNTKEEQVIDVVFYAKLFERPDITVDGEEVKSYVWMNQKEIFTSEQVHEWLKKALKVFDRIN
jgi:isopentenyldiphosphate isomerase